MSDERENATKLVINRIDKAGSSTMYLLLHTLAEHNFLKQLSDAGAIPLFVSLAGGFCLCFDGLRHVYVHLIRDILVISHQGGLYLKPFRVA